MQEVVTVIAEMTFKEGRGAEAVEALRPLVDAAVDDAGTLTYALYTDAKSPDRIVFFERYASADAFRAHGKDPQLQQVLGDLGSLMADRPVLRQLSAVAATGL